MARQPLVAGNWKMNGRQAFATDLLAGLGERLVAGVEVVVCPPFPYLGALAHGPGAIKPGAQNVARTEDGAFTGEVSAEMLADCGCQYVIIGHSERRALFAEDDACVADKYQRAQAAGLTPILCLGETLEERENGDTEAVIARQLDAVLERHGAASLARAVIAYEPVWAIGTGKTATPEQAQAVHAFIRERVAGHDHMVADGLRILYGGSVKADNAASLFGAPDIDGGLIGGASLDIASFAAICEAAAN